MKLLKTLVFGVLTTTGIAMGHAESGVVYSDKHVRITTVADGLVRMEYSPKGRFTDARTQVAYQRSYPHVETKVRQSGDTVFISTPRMLLQYIKSKGPFTTSNLKVTSVGLTEPVTWAPGMEQKQNLWGTTTTLDRWDGNEYFHKVDGEWKREPRELEKGLLSRDGWTLIDDSRNYLLDNDAELPWVQERPKDKGAQDWYLMVYGKDYKQALKDFTTLSGKMPMPPRYAFGYWWSRWWAYSDHELRTLADNFKSYGIPLEILVVDMDWHYTDKEHGGWTGWTWNKRLFPNPEGFINYLRDNNLKITLNLHPASGVKKFEASYPQIARENGVNPETGKDIPWVSSDKRFIKSVFKHILDPMSDQGVNFWWLDWQQEPKDSIFKNLSNIWWLNHTFYNHMKTTREARPMVFHRWGGLGNHRYPIGFSGDSYATWNTLSYMPYFTATASNVCYGYWCHDIGGFYPAPGDTALNKELYARSFQLAAYSPMMRTHSTKSAKADKAPWTFDAATLDLIRDAVTTRYRMVPYIYTMARKAYDTGVSLCRPMYYDYPQYDIAYNLPQQYMYGDNMIIAPVHTPAVKGYSSVDVWLPQGLWYEEPTGTLLQGDRTYTRSFAADEVPVYVKGGSVIPHHARKETALRTNDTPFMFTVYPGGDGEFTVYEDNGDDQRYDTEYATTKVQSRHNGDTLRVDIGPRQGGYKEMPATRQMKVRVMATMPPVSVKVDGKDCKFEYDPQQLASIVSLPLADASVSRRVEMVFGPDATVADGTIGNMQRFVKAFGQLKNRYPRLEVTEDFGPLSVVYEAIGYYPQQTDALIEQFRSRFARLPEILKEQPMSEEARAWMLEKVLPSTDANK